MDDEDQAAELVMPFVTVTSRGGPHDDQSFTAGWQMGWLYCHLEHVAPMFYSDTIREECRDQADLIAMKYGYQARFEDAGDEWLFMSLTRVADGE
jgi:hypothetical protein